MTWSTARGQIVTALEGVPESALESPHVYGRRLKHVPNLLQVRTVGRARSFAVTSEQAQRVQLSRGANRTQQQCTITIDYPIETQADNLDGIIWADYIVITDRLLDESQWNRPTSTIISVTLDPIDMVASTETIDDGDKPIARRLTFDLIVTHTENAP